MLSITAILVGAQLVEIAARTGTLDFKQTPLSQWPVIIVVVIVILATRLF